MKGLSKVNGKFYSKDYSIHLNEGDEVVFNLSVKPRRMFLLNQRSYISSVTSLQNMFQLSRHCVREFYCQYLQETSKEPDSVKETSKPERTSVFTKRAAATTLQLKKPASSVEADITGGSTISSQAQPKQEAYTASSKN